MGVKVSAKSSKKAAQAAAAKEAAKKKQTPKPASKKATPKKKTSATVAPKTKKQIEAEAKKAALEAQLNKDADKAFKELTDGVPDLLKRGASLQAVLEDVTKRELWKRGANPFKSQTAYLQHFAQVANVSIRTLQGTMGAIKALPGVSAEKRKAIGTKKLGHLAAAAKKLRQDTGNPDATLPDEIIETAARKTEAEVEADLIARGLKTAPVNEEIPVDILSSEGDLRYSGDVPADQFYSMPSGVIDEAPRSAQPYNQDIVDAIAMARLIYSGELSETAGDGDVLLLIVRQWKKFPTCALDLEDMTHEQAFDHLGGKLPSKANGKKKKK